MKNKKTIAIVILSVLLVAAVILIIYLWDSKTNSLNYIQGRVVVSDNGYVIVESGEESYLINDVKGKYNVGDEVKFIYKEKNLDVKNNPKSIKIDDEELVKEYKEESTDMDTVINKGNNSSTSGSSINDNKGNTTNNNSNNGDKEPNKNTGSTSVVPPAENGNADTVVLNYFNELNTEFRASTIKDSVKSGFITVIDFLFYDGSIKGHTFSELSESVKLKVLSMAMYFDSKIDKYFPGYKEGISSTASKAYTSVKSNIVKAYLNLTTKICSENEELCESAKNDFNVMKKSFGLTWSLIKDIAGDASDSIKSWYEIYSGKTSQ